MSVGAGPLAAVSCPAANQCTALTQDADAEVTFNPNSPGTPTPVQLGFPATAVSCPTVTQCSAVGSFGDEVMFDPEDPGSPAPEPVDPAGATLAGVACPSSAQCTAIELNAYMSDPGEVTFDPTSPGSPAPFVIDTSSSGTLRAVACPSASQCTAVSGEGTEYTFAPASPGTPTPTTLFSDDALVDSVACPAIDQCTAVNDQQQEITFDPQSGVAANAVTLEAAGSDHHLTGVACPSATQCTAIDDYGDEVSFDPQSPGTPPVVDIDGTLNELNGISCPDVDHCTAVDGRGDEVTFDPAGSIGTAPSVSLGTAQAVSESVESLSGSVNPHGFSLSSCGFEVQSSVGSVVAEAPCSPPPGSGTASVPLSVHVKGLISGKTYSYVLTATSDWGTATSTTASFVAGTYNSGPPPPAGSCSTGPVTFSPAIVASGCFSRGKGGSYVTSWQMVLNGITFDPLNGGSLTLSKSAGSIVASGDGVVHAGALPLDDWNGSTSFELDVPAARITFSPPTSARDTLFGFGPITPIVGQFDAMSETSPEVTLTSQVGFDVLGGPPVSALVSAVADSKYNLLSVTLSSEAFTPDGTATVMLAGAFPITGVSCTYQVNQGPNPTQPPWTCGATFNLQSLFGAGGAGESGEGVCNLIPLPSVGVMIGFSADPLAVDSASVAAATNGPGVALSPLVSVNGFGFGFEFHPARGINGALTLGVGPLIDPDCPTKRPFQIQGSISYLQQSNGDYKFTLGGVLNVTLFNFSEQIANATYTQQSVNGATSYAFIARVAEISLPGGITISGAIDGEIAGGGRWQLHVHGGTLSGFGVSNVAGQGLASNIGAGGCATLSIGPWQHSVGFVHYWKSGKNDFGGCDLTGLVSVPGSAAAKDARGSTAGGGRRVLIPRGLTDVEIAAGGVGGAPLVELVSPTGQTFPAPATANQVTTSDNVLTLRVSDVDRTYFEISRPAAGVWHVIPIGGAAPPATIAIAKPLLAPDVHASVALVKHHYLLVWRMRTQPGMSVQFFERAPSGMLAAIATESAARGEIPLTPAHGPGGRRTLLAQILINQIPRTRDLIAGHYNAPKLLVPHATDAHYTLSGRAMHVSWRRAHGPIDGYELQLRLTDGTQSIVLVKRTSIEAKLPAGLTVRSVRIITRYDGASTSITTATRIIQHRRKTKKGKRLVADGELAKAEPKRLRYQPPHVAARLAFSGRRAKLHLRDTWP